jgi:hypothetical protein
LLAAQVALRWAVQHGVAVIPRSTRPKNMAANLQIFDFALSADQMAEIDALDGTDPSAIHAPPPAPRACEDDNKESCGAWADAGECTRPSACPLQAAPPELARAPTKRHMHMRRMRTRRMRAHARADRNFDVVRACPRLRQARTILDTCTKLVPPRATPATMQRSTNCET